MSRSDDNGNDTGADIFDTRPKRRLSDKIKGALDQAITQGRREIAERLELLHQSLVEDEALYVRRIDRDDVREDDEDDD